MELSLEQLTDACRPGGSSVLVSVTELEPAAGDLAGVAPARYLAGRNATYVYEDRAIDGQAVRTVMIDGKASTINRVEAAISTAIADGIEPLARTPRLVVTYEGEAPLADYDLPHRCFDGHVRAGTIEGIDAVEHAAYRALRDATPANARVLLETSPSVLVLGGWDSSRKAKQARYRSAFVGEIIGVLADQSAQAQKNPPRGGSRIDPFAAGVQLNKTDAEALLAGQEAELSPKTVDKYRKEIKSAAAVSGATLGLGNVPPTLDGLGQVSCQRIVRHHLLSFAALRQLRFGSGPAGDAACRALLAAWAINGMVRSQAELLLRANCDLVEASAPSTWLDQRHGQRLQLAPLTIEEADELLARALDQAEKAASVNWQGQILEVVGNPAVLRGALADDSEE